MNRKIIDKNYLGKILALISIAVLISCLAGCSNTVKFSAQSEQAGQAAQSGQSTENAQTAQTTLPEQNIQLNGMDQLKIHFIDVGQADSILIECQSQYMLVDAGNNEDADIIADYLHRLGVIRLEYLILTHAHEDHIGSADKIVNEFAIGKIYFPRMEQEPTTKTYRDLRNAVLAKTMKFTQPAAGSILNMGEMKAIILAPNGTKYEDSNDYSIVLKIVYGQNSFLLTGDAGGVSENEMLAENFDLSADVLKIGHHGSRSATSNAFLNKVNPKYAILSCGIQNDYGHPHYETMKKLQKRKISVYRTDQQGTIVLVSNGKDITFNVESGNYQYGR